MSFFSELLSAYAGHIILTPVGRPRRSRVFQKYHIISLVVILVQFKNSVSLNRKYHKSFKDYV
jgi:hypothetical protein